MLVNRLCSQPATIRDVAELAQLSPTTVSRFLNGKIELPEETGQRILRAVAQLGYQPNQLARGLKSGVTGTVGLILPDIMNPFFTALARGVQDRSKEHGLAVVICNTDNRPAEEWDYIVLLRQKRVDGMIIVSSGLDEGHLMSVVAAGIPLVFAGRHINSIGVDQVVAENERGTYEATVYLGNQGHMRIAFIAGTPQLSTSAERLAGYRRGLQALGLPELPALIATGDFQDEGGAAAMRTILQAPEPPTAVLAANDLMAIGAMRALTEAGFSVPADCSVMGFDNIPLASMVVPQLTTMAISAYEMGDTALSLLHGRLTRRTKDPVRSVTLHPQLVVRQSTARRAGAHDGVLENAAMETLVATSDTPG